MGRTLSVVVGEGNVGAALLEVVGLHHAVGLVRDLEVLHERLLHVPVELQQLTQPLRQALCCVRVVGRVPSGVRAVCCACVVCVEERAAVGGEEARTGLTSLRSSRVGSSPTSFL